MSLLKGQFLVASPELLDPNFARTVLLLFEHNKQGAAGVILNRPTAATISDISEHVFSERFDWEKSLCFGGPVIGPLLILHTDEDLADQEIVPGLYSTIDAVKVQVLLRRRAEPSLVIANYAGWGPGQLEAEIKEGSWSTTPATLDRAFDSRDEVAWAEIAEIAEAGKMPNVLGIREVPTDPSLN